MAADSVYQRSTTTPTTLPRPSRSAGDGSRSLFAWKSNKYPLDVCCKYRASRQVYEAAACLSLAGRQRARLTGGACRATTPGARSRRTDGRRGIEPIRAAERSRQQPRSKKLSPGTRLGRPCRAHVLPRAWPCPLGEPTWPYERSPAAIASDGCSASCAASSRSTGARTSSSATDSMPGRSARSAARCRRRARSAVAHSRLCRCDRTQSHITDYRSSLATPRRR